MFNKCDIIVHKGGDIVNFTAIKMKMVEKGITQKQLAKLLKISQTSMSKKMNRITDFTSSEISFLIEYFEVDANYFFN